MAIRDLQARIEPIGKIRTGQRVPSSKNPDRLVPDKLQTFRFTSPLQHLIEAVAAKYGGEVKPWQGSNGPEFEVITGVSVLSVFLPQQHIDPWYELWGDKIKYRQCDGVTEQLRGQPCLCLATCRNGERDCKPTTRFLVNLAEVPGLNAWSVESHGVGTAEKLIAVARLVDQLPNGMFLPARLAMKVRKINKLEIKNGVEQVKGREYTVIDLAVDVVTAAELNAGPGAIAAALGRAPAQGALAAGNERLALSATAEPTRDWLGEIHAAETIDQLRALWREIGQAGALDDYLRSMWKQRAEQISAKQAPARPAESMPAGPAPATDEPPAEPRRRWSHGSPVDQYLGRIAAATSQTELDQIKEAARREHVTDQAVLNAWMQRSQVLADEARRREYDTTFPVGPDTPEMAQQTLESAFGDVVPVSGPPELVDPDEIIDPSEPPPDKSADQLYNEIAQWADEMGWTTRQMNAEILKFAGVSKISEATPFHLASFLNWVKTRAREHETVGASR